MIEHRIQQLEDQKRELLALLSATLWVLEHPDVNAIRFCGNPRELAQRIRRHLERGGMAAPPSEPANAKLTGPRENQGDTDEHH